MGEVWLATQIPPFFGLFSLEELGEEANYLVYYKKMTCENCTVVFKPSRIYSKFTSLNTFYSCLCKD